MRVLMIGRSPSIALDELRKYWGDIDIFTRRFIPTLKRYDLVIAQEPTLRIGIPAMLQAKISNSYFICEIHSDYLYPRFFPIKDLLSARIILKVADAVRAVNKRIKTRLDYWKVKRILVIPSVYIRPNIFKPYKDVEERGSVLLSASRLVAQKGLDLLINAVPYLMNDFPNLEVRIIGDGPEKNKLEMLVRKLGLCNVVKFLGWVSQRELIRQYNNAAIFICTSHHEGGPRTVFEAAACLTPSVSTPVGIIPEVMKDGESVVLVRRRDPKLLAQKIKELLQDEKKRAYIAKKAREITIREFEWSKAIKRYAQAYLNLLNQR